MGAAKRFDVSSHPSPADEQPEVDLGFEWLVEEETEPWCVDDGSRIVVMRTREIRREIGGGTLHDGVKVWRDGRARWLPAREVYELHPERDEEAHLEEEGAFSRIRRVRRPDIHERQTRPRGSDGSGPRARPGWWRRTLQMFFGQMFVG